MIEKNLAWLESIVRLLNGSNDTINDSEPIVLGKPERCHQVHAVLSVACAPVLSVNA